MERGSMADLQFSSNKSGRRVGIRALVTGTWPENLPFQVDIIELYIYEGLSQRKIARIMGCTHKTVQDALKKYYPKQGEHDIVMSIMSKV